MFILVETCKSQFYDDDDNDDLAQNEYKRVQT